MLVPHIYHKTSAPKISENLATMESLSKINDEDGNNKSYSYRYSTNWAIDGGSLESSVTFETSDFPIDPETVDYKRKSPLILKPISDDCGPCEIKISFNQKHEVRQVYVRSTARVYEIYFAPSLQSSNEYLCTVRCGVAARDDEELHPTDTEEPSNARSNGSATELAKEKCNDDGTIISNEDGWVEVKVPYSSLQDNENYSMLKKIDGNPGTRVQDFYEATAEITDADACVSLTFRLLSLQSKGSLCIDEIYVFADVVESDDSETQAPQVGNSAGNSFMAMLAPTLLQLSKTGINRIQDKHASDSREKGNCLEVGSTSTSSTHIANVVQQEESIAALQCVKLPNDATPEPRQFHIPAQVSDKELRHESVSQTDVQCDHIGRTLEQLVSRVGRIEDFCLRFEENMLKPISSMEARLQRVEQQMELLVKNLQYTGLPHCTRISAPVFSCSGSNSSSCYEGSDYPACGQFELDKTDIPCNKVSNPPDDTSVSVNGNQVLPGLIVTAPEFSCGDDEENNDTLEPSEDCPPEQLKQALSIDDALAAALAGFLSSSSVQPSSYTQKLAVKAPDFAIEETGDEGEVASVSAQIENPIVPPIFSYESNGTACVNDLILTSSGIPSIPDLAQMMGNFDDDDFKETSEGVDGHNQLHEGKTCCSSPGTDVDRPTTHAEHELAQTDDCQISESTIREEGNDGINLSVSEIADILRHFLQNPTEDSPEILNEEDASSTEDIEEGSAKDTLQKVLLSPSASCVVDFELPILDVKFASWETSSVRSPLDALLTDNPELEAEAPCTQQKDDAVVDGQSNLIPMEDGEANSPLTSDRLLVDLECYERREVPSSAEGEAIQDSYACNEQVMFPSLI
ncbi:Exosome complex component Rrp41 like [Actinidia chinensis var. chinensis]|uniref:Exosome complex component Rrp41 like n=1 Tax=Actinidia chinensis var. chinensis TaxID=1590841 RepID=A0A2R6RD37_ACTCC|nr:Exosome complex component Rrp41 like [Actinidia chinensis var. chinensis]